MALRGEGCRKKEDIMRPARVKQTAHLVQQPGASLPGMKWYLAPDVSWGKWAMT